MIEVIKFFQKEEIALRLELDMPKGLEQQLTTIVLNATQEALNRKKRLDEQSEWMDLKTGAKYAGVSYATFIKFRELGLQVVEIDGIKRISKDEINRFYKENQF